MNIFRELIKFIYWISLLLFRDKTQKHKQIEASAPAKDPADVYYTQALGRFQDTYRKYTPAEMNANIDAAFYNVSEFKKAVELPDNELDLDCLEVRLLDQLVYAPPQEESASRCLRNRYLQV